MIFRFDKKYQNSFWVAIIVLLTLIAYWPAFFADFTNFDDNRYVTENPMVWSLESSNISKIFTSYYDGHYHPLTMLSLAVDFSISGMKPWLFHLVNILFHLINTLLVFILIKRLVDNKDKFTIAVIVASLFGVHSFHVESVAWISERKDVLFAFFFLMALIFYLDYIKSKKPVYFILTLVFFILSCMSKGQAVALAPTVFLIDYFKNRPLFSRRISLEKIPFFLIASFFGYLAMKAHATFPYISSESFPLYDRVVYACYAFFMYLGKIILPIGLSAYYPYPAESPAIMYLVFPLLILALGALLVYFYKRNKILVFGILFYAVNIILVLKIFEVHLQTGKFIIADRYSYIPSIGIFLLFGYLYNYYAKKRSIGKLLPGIIFAAYLLMLTIMTFQRVKVWDNSISLWNSVVKQYPELSWAYGKRALAKSNLGDFRGAFNDNSIAIKLDPNDPHAWNNRGKLRAQTAVSVNLQGNILRDSLFAARKDLDKAIETGNKFFEAYANRGLVNLYLGDLTSASNDLNKAIELMPSYAISYYNRGLVFSAMGKFDKAIIDFNQTMELNPKLTQAIFYRGIAYLNSGRFQESIDDLSLIISENKKNVSALLHRATAYESIQNISMALQDINKVIKIQPNFSETYFKRANLIFRKGAIPSAIEDYKMAIKLNPDFADSWFNLGLAFMEMDSIENACKCLDKAESLGLSVEEKRVKWNCIPIKYQID